MGNIDEIKTLIALTGNKRIPDLEAEIFADATLTKLYLHTLCKTQSWYIHYNSISFMAYAYAVGVMNTPWPEAESIIKIDRDIRNHYDLHFKVGLHAT